jgi:hypothetical protein
MAKKPMQQAPKLANGEPRVKDYGRLPSDIKEGLRAIARMEGRSMSWVKEQVIIDYFHLKRPKYVTDRVRKNNVVPMRRRA